MRPTIAQPAADSRPARAAPWQLRGAVGIWLYRAAILFALVLAPAGYLAYQAMVDPAVAFLPPSLHAEWVKHPEQLFVPLLDGEAIAVVEFSREFELADEPKDIVLDLAAFGRAYVLLNGQPVWSSDGSDWKRLSVVHLHDGLRRGTNQLAVRVHNVHGFPTILVDEPVFLRTPSGWQASLAPEFSDPVDAVPALFFPIPAGPLQLSRAWPVLRYATPLWLALWIGVAIVGCFSTAMAPAEAPLFASATRSAKVQGLLPLGFVLVAVVLNLANAASYPYERSPFDSVEHVEYIERVADTWSPPMASDGWQMFQPPLYYYVAAAVYTLFGKGVDALKAVQFVSALAGCLLPVIAWLQLRLFRPRDVRGTWVATALVAFLPMSLYMNPIVSNEAFAGTTIAVAIYLSLRLLASESPRPTQSTLAGLASGAALLAKFTGLFSFLATVVCLGWAALWARRRGGWRALATFGAVALLVAGWFYARNIVAYGKPFVGAWDSASGFAFVQEPTFRTAGFFLNVGHAFFQHPTSSLWTGFFDGQYATVWSDAQLNFFSEGNRAAMFWMSILLLLGAAPSIVTLFGLGSLFAKVLASPSKIAHLAMVAIIATTCWSLVFFAVSVPTYSSIKAFYGLSLVPSLAVCFATGRERLGRRTPWAVALLDGNAVLVAMLAGLAFRW